MTTHSPLSTGIVRSFLGRRSCRQRKLERKAKCPATGGAARSAANVAKTKPVAAKLLLQEGPPSQELGTIFLVSDITAPVRLPMTEVEIPEEEKMAWMMVAISTAQKSKIAE